MTQGVYIDKEVSTGRTSSKPWRIVISGTNLVIQQLVNRVWTTKDTITGE